MSENNSVNIKASVEAVLFAIGNAVEKDKICKVLGTEEKPYSKKELERICAEMMTEYDAEDRGIRLIEVGDKYQLCTKNEYYEPLTRLVNTPKKHTLTDVVLETLSIIAYKQPVTRAQIEKIRGVSCDHAINRLLEYGLVCEAGRLDAPGRPILFGTTEEFLRHFGTDSLDDLPRISPVKVEDFKAEAEEEAKLKLDV